MTDDTNTSDANIVSETTAEDAASTSAIDAVSRVKVPSAAVLIKSANVLSRAAELTVIASAEDREFAVSDLQDIKTALEAHEAKRRAITDPMNAAIAATMALFKPAKDLMEAADKQLRAKVLAFDADERRKAAEAKAKAEAEQREKQRKAAADAAEASRIAEEEARKLQAKAQTAADAGNFAEAAATEMEAAAVQQTASTAVAEAQATIFAPPPAPAYVAAKKSGTASTTKYKLELTDLSALIKHIASNPAHMVLVTFDQSAANKFATGLKTGAADIPGTKLVEVESLTVRGKK